jgi:hypothetical protein
MQVLSSEFSLIIDNVILGAIRLDISYTAENDIQIATTI